MTADVMAFAHAARRARLLGAMEAASVSRHGKSVDERYQAVCHAIVGASGADADQERYLFGEFATAFADSAGLIVAAQPIETEDDDPTLVDPLPKRIKKTRRFLYWLLPCLVLTSACGDASAPTPAPSDAPDALAADVCGSQPFGVPGCFTVREGDSNVCGTPYLGAGHVTCCCPPMPQTDPCTPTQYGGHLCATVPEGQDSPCGVGVALPARVCCCEGGE